MEVYFNSISAKPGTVRKIIEDVKVLVADIISLLRLFFIKNVDNLEVDEISIDYFSTSSIYRQHKEQLAEKIKQHPLKYVGIALAIGILVGYWIAKKD